MIEILKTDGTPATDVVIADWEAGADSAAVSLDVWADRGNPTGQDADSIVIVVHTEDPTSPGTFVASGVPPQDEGWWQIRVVGQVNTDRPDQEPFVTGWQTAGAWSGLLIPRILAGAARRIEIRAHAPGYAPSRTWRVAVLAIWNEASRPLPAAASLAQRGILTGVGDPARSGLIRGGEVSVSDPPDNVVHVAGALWLQAGALRGKVTSDHELNDEDVAESPLATGQSYWAALSLSGTGVSVTKGTKAVAPSKPAPPAGEVFLRWVSVSYTGAAPEIDDVDLAGGGPAYDRYLVESGEGLEVVIHPGQAIGGGSWRFSSRKEVIPLEASSTSYLWQRSNGLPELTSTQVAPDTSALGPWWKMTTSATEVTELTDLRTYAEPTIVLRLRGDLPGSPGTVDSLLILEALYVEAITFRVSDNGGGSAGGTQLDIEVDGSTFYTSHATEDFRPTIAFDAVELVASGGFHELTELRPGALVTLLSLDHPTGGSPLWAEAYLVCRRR
jgi:hypothetical protein